jgi:hypothetical protein
VRASIHVTSILVLGLLGGCGASVTPNVLVAPNVQQLPPDHRQAEVMSNAAVRPGESKRPLSRNQKRAVTAAASAAAVLGWIFSKSDNTVVGIGFDVDDATPAYRSSDPEPAPPPPAAVPAGELVPWVPLRAPAPAPAPAP